MCTYRQTEDRFCHFLTNSSSFRIKRFGQNVATLVKFLQYLAILQGSIRIRQNFGPRSLVVDFRQDFIVVATVAEVVSFGCLIRCCFDLNFNFIVVVDLLPKMLSLLFFVVFAMILFIVVVIDVDDDVVMHFQLRHRALQQQKMNNCTGPVVKQLKK